MVHRRFILPRPVPAALVGGLNAKLSSCLDPEIRARLSREDPGVVEIDIPDHREEEPILGQVAEIAASILKGAQFFEDYRPEVLHENLVPMPHPTPDFQTILAQRGDITFLGEGLVGFSGHFLEVMECFDASFLQMALASGARQVVFPDLLPLQAAERSGYVEGFLDQCTFAQTIRRDVFLMNELLARTTRGPSDYHQALEGPAHVLNPALCYNAYLSLSGSDLPEDRFLTLKGRCFRREAVSHPNLLRLHNFTVRELVCIGKPEAVERWRHSWMERVYERARNWGLRFRVVVAHDPFFVRDHTARKLYQLTHRIKYEMQGEVPGSPEGLALSSFNWHADHFTRAFGITRGGGGLHSACVGFGLERWAACFLAQHGPDAMPEGE